MAEATPRGINRRLPVEVTANLIDRLNAGVDKCGPDDCWNWLRGFRNGYGAIKHQGRVHSAHRVAYIVAKGEPAADLLITHTCDNRACCNPAHLVAGTPTDNVREMHERGVAHSVKGSLRPNAVINESIVARIWSLKKPGFGARRIAAELGVTESQVKRVLIGRSWNHLRPASAKGTNQ
jgi:hypothetical protein